ncbi:MAG: T9SS type A sorting domain-containing protein [Bacteroidales bacterium]
MKNLCYLLVAVLIPISVFSQAMEIAWQQCFGGSEQDNVKDIVEVPGGYLIVGWTESNNGDISFNHGGSDGWILKTDSIGNILWDKTYGGSKGDNFFRIFSDNSGNYFILGVSNSSDGDISYDPYTDSWDHWILKIDLEGNIIWDKIIGGNESDVLKSGSPTIDGGIVAIGWTYSTDGDISVNYGSADTWAVKISSEGELEWDYTIGTDWIDKGQAILATSDGGYLISSNSSIHEDAIGNITCTPHSYGFFEGVLFKLDANLNIEWQRCYGGSNDDGIFGILEIEDGYVFTGSTSSNDGDVSGWHGESDSWIVKLDFDGNIVWQNPLGGSRSESGSNILQTTDEVLISFVSTYSNNGDVSGNHSQSEFDSDIWFVKLNSEGELIFQQCFGGEGSEIINFGVVKKSDNNYVIAAQTDYGPSYDVGCTPHGGNGVDTDWWVFEIDSLDTTGAVENEYGKDLVKVYPNPAGEYVVFEFSAPPLVPPTGGKPTAQIQIFDVFGREVLKKPVVSEKTVIDLRNVKKGVYFYRIEIENKIYTGKVVTQK